jgi:uncharacterized membrane protein YoaK (UPF0700 family)
LALGVELLMLVGVAAGWLLSGKDPAGGPEDALVVLAGLAMGLQSAAVRQLRVEGVATTYVTGTLTALLAGLVNRGAARGGLLRQGGVLLTLVAGAVVGAAAVGAAGGVAALIPVVLVAAVVAIAAWARPAPGRSGQGESG